MSRPIASIQVKITRNGTGDAIALSDAQKRQLIAASTAATEAEAKLQLQAQVYSAPVAPSGYQRTGNLMASTGSAIQDGGDSGIVFSSADYAIYVHEGARGTSPRPYLVDALKKEAKRIAARARRIAGGGTS